MKRFIRILSISLAAMLLLSAAGVSFAASDTAVYIPYIIEKLGLPDMPEYITLKTKTESAVMKDKNGEIVYQTEGVKNPNGRISYYTKYDYNGNPIPVYGTQLGADIELQFSEQPEWAGVIWADGYETLKVDESGYAKTSMVGHNMQPGINIVKSVCDPVTGELIDYEHDGGDYAYLAGKNNVAVQYGRSGSVNYVEYTVDQDFFRTGMEGASTVIRWEPVQVITDCYKEAREEQWFLVWDQDDYYDDYYDDPTVGNTGRTDSFVTNQWGNLVYNDNMRMFYCDQTDKYIPVDGSAYYDPNTNRLYDQYGEELMILPPNVCCCDKKQQKDPYIYWPDNGTSSIQIPVARVTDATPLTVWYISTVTATYPAGNYIVGVEADWRNDKKKTLASYKITYEPKQGEQYKITYSPITTTVLEDKSFRMQQAIEDIYDKDYSKYEKFSTWSNNTPSTIVAGPEYDRTGKKIMDGVYFHHYTEDEVLSGLYTSGSTVLCSGSGKNLKKWYKFNGVTTLKDGTKRNNLGKQVKKNGLKPCTSFISPRVVD